MRLNSRVWLGLVLIVVGFLFILDEHSSFHISEVLLSLWPLLLVGTGVHMLLRSRRKEDDSFLQTSPLADIGLGRRIDETAAPTVRLGNIFGEVRSKVTSPVFAGGSVSTIFGQAIVDLTAASLAPGEHTLKMDSVLGTVIVRLPRGMACSVVADGVIGTVRAGGRHRNGFFPSIHFTPDGYRDAVHRIHLDLSTVIGEVRVDVEGE
jgi:predicted membrane protein